MEPVWGGEAKCGDGVCRVTVTVTKSAVIVGTMGKGVGVFVDVGEEEKIGGNTETETVERV